MKTTKLALATLAALGGLALANTAAAGTDVRIGFRYGGYGAPAPAYCPPPVVVEHHRPSGYWKEVVVKTWVPECYVTRHDRWGRPMRMLERGHFAYRNDRVWVDHRR